VLLFYALKDAWKEGFSLQTLRSDVISGITVGIVAIPLGMALSIAVGIPPQYGLYTVIVGGIFAALCGGSRVNITGPTAAFVVILIPIVQKYGLSGLLLATMMAGVILLIMGLCRLGRLVLYVPYPVTTGFTAGIGFSIAFLQIKDLLNIQLLGAPATFPDKVMAYYDALPSASMSDALVGIFSILAFIFWAKLKNRIPPHVVALIIGTIVAFVLDDLGSGHAVLLGEKFTYVIDGVTGHGIPQQLPHFSAPWANIDISWDLINELLPSALTIAVLGSIESLLCAVVADGMSGKKHNPNAELVGQGIANIIAPFFGGIPGTAAIARTATNVRSGAFSSLSGVIHAIFVLLAMLALAPALSYIPMSALAGLLIMVAWNMSEAPHFVHIIKVAPRRDVAVLLTCFFLTVIFDMVVAVAVGITLACMLFIHRVSALTNITMRRPSDHHHLKDIGDDILIYDINGPLFFGACETAMSVISRVKTDYRAVVLDFSDVNTMDMTGIHALESAIGRIGDRPIIFYDVSANVEKKLYRSSLIDRKHTYSCHTKEALQRLMIFLRG